MFKTHFTSVMSYALKLKGIQWENERELMLSNGNWLDCEKKKKKKTFRGGHLMED